MPEFDLMRKMKGRELIHSVQWQNIGEEDESLDVRFYQPDGSIGLMQFAVGADAFLENPNDQNAILAVPEDELVSCTSTACIIPGIIAGSKEFERVHIDQGDKNFQTIVGDVKITGYSYPDGDTTGLLIDVEYQKVGKATKRTVQTDIHILSNYAQRRANYAMSMCCIPGALHREFGYKKSDLGADGSTERQNVEAYLKGDTATYQPDDLFALWV